MKGIVWDGDRAVLTEADLPEPAGEWVRVEVDHVGLCGTDLHIIDGSHPRARPGLLLGHEFAGRVRVRSPTAGLRDGQPVFVNPLVQDQVCSTCRRGLVHLCPGLRIIGVDLPGALASSVVVPARQLVPLPDDMNPRLAAVIEPTATAVRAVRRSGLSEGDHVHVAGFGPIGLLVARIALQAGAGAVTVSELPGPRALAAVAAGFEVVPAPAPAADIVFDCVGLPAVSEHVTSCAAIGGTVVIVGMHSGVAPVNLLDVTMRELAIVGSKAYTPQDVAAAIELLTSGALDVRGLVSSVVELADVPAMFDRMKTGHEMKVLVHIGQ